MLPCYPHHIPTFLKPDSLSTVGSKKQAVVRVSPKHCKLQCFRDLHVLSPQGTTVGWKTQGCIHT